MLLVDDDQSMRRALARIIRLAGFDIETFESAEALLAHGVSGPNTCLVLDIDLPGLDGIELKRRLDGAGHKVPTIFITALSAGGLSERLAALAPVAVLHKPFAREELLAALASASHQEEKSRYH